MEQSQGATYYTAQKRNRQQLSCTFCRAGKLKCNRQQPCDQCIKRSRDQNCTYLAAPAKRSRNRNTKDRIAHLEGLVVQLINQGANSIETSSNETGVSPSSWVAEAQRQARDLSSGSGHGNEVLKDGQGRLTGEQNDAAVAFGQMKITKGETSYVGSAHWEAVLDGIEELKASLDDDDEHENSPTQLEDRPSPDESSDARVLESGLMLRVRKPMTREALLRSMPPKEVTEKLLWHWFNSNFPELPAIHSPTFLAEYQTLLTNPSEIPTMWLAMCFGVLSLGSASAAVTGSTARLGDPRHYRRLCAEALALADYTKPKKYTIEALLMLCACEHVGSTEVSLQVWLYTGLLLRLAMRMGYHRDPSLYPSITPFEGEMRRRIWYLVYIFDVLTSFSLGLPDMIRQIQSDTQVPRNILDSDFGVDSVEIPPSRPFTELSSVSIIIAKSQLVKVFARAADISHAVETPPYQDVLTLEAELERVHAEIPPTLRFVTMQSSIVVDPPHIIFTRFKLELMYQKTRCVLHRRYLNLSNGDPAEEASRDVCADSAMKLLQHLETVHLASQEGGQLSSAPFFLNALSVHDFLLAAMVLCLEINRLAKLSLADPRVSREKMFAMKALLETTYRVYSQPCTGFTPPEKAVKALDAMLSRVKDMGMFVLAVFDDCVSSNISVQLLIARYEAFDENDRSAKNLINDNHKVAATPLTPNTPQHLGAGFDSFGGSLQQNEFYEPIEEMFGDSQGLDWKSWDKFIQNPVQDIDESHTQLLWDEQVNNIDFNVDDPALRSYDILGGI